MAYGDQIRPRDRIGAASGVIAVNAALVAALLLIPNAVIEEGIDDTLKVFEVNDPPPPPAPPPEPAPKPSDAPEGAAAPENIRSKATPVVAPPPKVRLEQPSPVVAAPVAGTGSQASQGASDRPGPGTGAGGQGTGTGSGGSGSGTGSGGVAARSFKVRGEITRRDFPRGASRINAAGTVTVQFTVQPSGRVTGCGVTQSSGNPDLDATTCRLIEQRFRYEPARDRNGNPIGETRGWRQEWFYTNPG